MIALNAKVTFGKGGGWILLLSLLLLIIPIQLSFAAMQEPEFLSLEKAVEAAQRHDPWLVGNKHSQDSVESMSVAVGTMPDPRISVGLANVPTDSFDFDQEPMTQVKVGVTQMIPRGDSLAIKRRQLEVTGSQYPFQRQNRKAQLTVMVSQIWLDAYGAQESIRLIDKDRPLFEQLADVAEAGYSSAMGKMRQQDLIRAQLELTRLDDRLTVLRQKKEMKIEKLSQWVTDSPAGPYGGDGSGLLAVNWSRVVLQEKIPDIKMLKPSLYLEEDGRSLQELYEYFSHHPAVAALDKKIKASSLGIDLAKQSYKPKWGINAGYGYREDDRADFLSVGISFDLPVFTKNRQDKGLESAVSKTEATKTQKLLLVRKMIADFEKAKAQLVRLDERQNLYQKQLLPQMHEQADASLTAYTNDDGDFAEVVRSRIAELNAQIMALNIDVERQKAIIQLNYYFMGSAGDIVEETVHIGDTK